MSYDGHEPEANRRAHEARVYSHRIDMTFTLARNKVVYLALMEKGSKMIEIK